MASTTEVATCADWISGSQFRLPMLGALSGTTIMSPGINTESIGLPDHILLLLFFAAKTDPSARITNAAFLSASCVNPPACPKYQLALLPATKPTAVGLNICP